MAGRYSVQRRGKHYVVFDVETQRALFRYRTARKAEQVAWRLNGFKERER